MSSRYRIPETTKLQLSLGDWLLVKKHLTAGEERRMYSSMSVAGETVTVDLPSVQPMKMAAYLLDWSLTDASHKPVVIADQPREVVVAALDGLPPEDFDEIWEAIAAHEKAMKALREQEKNALSGGATSSPISPSVESSTGPLPTLTDSMLTSIAS